MDIPIKLHKIEKSLQIPIKLPKYAISKRIYGIRENLLKTEEKEVIICLSRYYNERIHNMKKKELFKKIVEKSSVISANTTTCGIFFQPKAPAALKKFSKVENDK